MSDPRVQNPSQQSGTAEPGVQFRPGHGFAELARQVLLVGCAVLFYFAVRGLTQGSESTAVDNGRSLLDLEARFGLDLEHGTQRLIEDSPLLITLFNWVYIWLHWPVVIATLLWLHHSRRFDYLELRNAMFISGAIGLVIFASFPVAPPRLADVGLVDTVTERSISYRLLQPPSLVNKYAAVPSLHVGWNLLVGIALLRATTRRPVRVFAYVAPALMAVAVVATANHYVVDGVFGAIVSLVGLAISRKITKPLAEHVGPPGGEPTQTVT